MDILNGIKIAGLCLYLKKYKVLVIADLHLGYEESLNKKGILVPRTQFSDIYDRLKNILNSFDIKTVVITGDLKHEFGIINDSERKNIISIIDLILKRSKKLIILKGNHDVTLPYIIGKKGLELLDYYLFGEIFICHGDDVIENEDFRKSRVIIIGHEHPAIGLREKAKYESFKCFLKGRYKNKTLIVVPSFNPLTVGTDILRNELLSPFLQGNIMNFEAYVIESNKVYNFGKLKHINK